MARRKTRTRDGQAAARSVRRGSSADEPIDEIDAFTADAFDALFGTAERHSPQPESTTSEPRDLSDLPVLRQAKPGGESAAALAPTPEKPELERDVAPNEEPASLDSSDLLSIEPEPPSESGVESTATVPERRAEANVAPSKIPPPSVNAGDNSDADARSAATEDEEPATLAFRAKKVEPKIASTVDLHAPARPPTSQTAAAEESPHSADSPHTTPEQEKKTKQAQVPADVAVSEAKGVKANVARPTEKARGAKTSVARPGRGTKRDLLELREALNAKDKALVALRSELVDAGREALKLKDALLTSERNRAAMAEKLAESERELKRLRRERDVALADKHQAHQHSEAHQRRAEKLARAAEKLRSGNEQLVAAHAAHIEAAAAEHERALARLRSDNEQLVAAHAARLKEHAAEHERALTKLRSDNEQLVAAHAARLKEQAAEHERALDHSRAEADRQLAKRQAVSEAMLESLQTQAGERLARARDEHERAVAEMKQESEQLHQQLDEALANLARSEAREEATQQTLDYAKDVLEAARAALERS